MSRTIKKRESIQEILNGLFQYGKMPVYNYSIHLVLFVLNPIDSKNDYSIPYMNIFL